MHFANTLLLTLLSFLTLLSPVFTRSRDLPSRQYHSRRALLDVCVNLDVDVDIPVNVLDLLGLGPIHLDICLCLSALPLIIQENTDLSLVASVLGVPVVTDILQTLVVNAPGSEHCSYPDNSSPVCSSSNPCGWNCNPPYVAVGDTCHCPSPNIVCNGQCGSFPHGCGSAVARAVGKKRQVRSAAGAMTLTEAQSTCKVNESVCGVYSRPYAFECLNTNTNLESCGGCVVPNPYLEGADAQNAPVGTDCTTLKNVEDVACVSGKCVIQKCRAGFNLDSRTQLCVVHASSLRLNSQNYMARSH